MSYTLTAQVRTLESENTLAIVMPSAGALVSLEDDAVDAFGNAVNCIQITPDEVFTPVKGQCYEMQYTAGETTEYKVNAGGSRSSLAVFTQSRVELEMKQNGTNVDSTDEICGDSPFPRAIAGYVPGSNVFQHNKIDLDQKAMEDALKAKNFKDNATHSATHWYSVGGNSMSKGNHRAPACAEKVPPRPCRSAWPRPAGMRGLGPGPLPITRPRAHPKRRRSTVPGRPAYACGHCCGLRGVPRYLGCQGCPPRARL